jgi:hypothetical protein
MQYHAVTVTAGSITGEMETSSSTVEPTPRWAVQESESTGTGSSRSEVAEETEEFEPEARPTEGVGRVMRHDGVVVGGAAAVIAFIGATL